MSEPARDSEDRASAQDELDAILREAMVMRNSGGPVNDFDEEAPEPARTGPVLVNTTAPAGTLDAGAPAEGVKFDRYKIKIPEAGPNIIPTYQINAQIPIAAVLGAIAFALWMFVPGGIQFLRPEPVPDAFVDASARWTLALTRQRITAFEQQQGRLPQSLEELDPNLSEVVTYQGLPEGGFVLTAPGHRQMFTLKTDTPQERFLGRTITQLRQPAGAGR